MGKKQERGREPESWAENGIERKRRDQKVKRSRSQTEQGAQLSDVREGEEERRGRGRRGRRRREIPFVFFWDPYDSNVGVLNIVTLKTNHKLT